MATCAYCDGVAEFLVYKLRGGFANGGTFLCTNHLTKVVERQEVKG